MLDKIKTLLMNSFGLTIGVLSFIYLIGWFANGKMGAKVELAELRQYIMWMAGILVTRHGIDSGLKSPIGQPVQTKGGNVNETR